MTYNQALQQIPATGSGCHSFLLSVANLGAIAGISEADIIGDIRANIPAGGTRRVPDKEIADAVRKALTECEPLTTDGAKHSPRRQRRPRRASKPFDGPTYRRKLIQRSGGVSEAELHELSPIRLTWNPGPMDAVALLDALYAPDDVLFIGGTYDTTVRTAKEWRRVIEQGKTWPHIIPNPVTGRKHNNRSGIPSWRCDASIADYRFAIAEFDEIDGKKFPHAEQLAFWHTIIADDLLIVAALIDSGNKSIHAWLRVNLPDATAWVREVEEGMYDPETGRMALLGADRSCRNPSRLSRLPGHFRAEKGKLQRLLYLNPQIRNQCR